MIDKGVSSYKNKAIVFSFLMLASLFKAEAVTALNAVSFDTVAPKKYRQLSELQALDNKIAILKTRYDALYADLSALYDTLDNKEISTEIRKWIDLYSNENDSMRLVEFQKFLTNHSEWPSIQEFMLKYEAIKPLRDVIETDVNEMRIFLDARLAVTLKSNGIGLENPLGGTPDYDVSALVNSPRHSLGRKLYTPPEKESDHKTSNSVDENAPLVPPLPTLNDLFKQYHELTGLRSQYSRLGSSLEPIVNESMNNPDIKEALMFLTDSETRAFVKGVLSTIYGKDLKLLTVSDFKGYLKKELESDGYDEKFVTEVLSGGFPEKVYDALYVLSDKLIFKKYFDGFNINLDKYLNINQRNNIYLRDMDIYKSNYYESFFQKEFQKPFFTFPLNLVVIQRMYEIMKNAR